MLGSERAGRGEEGGESQGDEHLLTLLNDGLDTSVLGKRATEMRVRKSHNNCSSVYIINI